MTISHATSVRNAIADQVDTLVNAGSSDANGDLVVLAGATELARFALEDPAFGAASSGQVTLQGTPIETTASATGTADTFQIQDKDNSTVISGSVSESGGGGDAIIDNASINNGQTVNLLSATYNASP